MPALGLSGDYDLSRVSVGDVEALHRCPVQFVTRHFNSAFSDSVYRGELYIRTLSAFRAHESGVLGRMSDMGEGRLSAGYFSPDGTYRLFTPTSVVDNVFIRNVPPGVNPLQIDYQFNDRCLCASLGPFRNDRAQVLRRKGNPDLDSYVVYDLKKLHAAFLHRVRTIYGRQQVVLGREMTYGERNTRLPLSAKGPNWVGPAGLEQWLRTAFTKPVSFSHEEEYRLLWTNVAKLGALSEHEQAISITSPQIAAAIVTMGEF